MVAFRRRRFRPGGNPRGVGKGPVRGRPAPVLRRFGRPLAIRRGNARIRAIHPPRDRPGKPGGLAGGVELLPSNSDMFAEEEAG